MRFKEYPRENTRKRALIHLVSEFSQAMPAQHSKVKRFWKDKKQRGNSNHVTDSKMLDIANNNEDSVQLENMETIPDKQIVHNKVDTENDSTKMWVDVGPFSRVCAC